MAAGSLAVWLYWNEWQLANLLPQLANVITVSAGTALLASILREAMTYMVLAAMKIREWKEQGREEGREEERKRQRRREEESYARFGVEVNGVLMLPRTPEVEQFLAGESEPDRRRGR